MTKQRHWYARRVAKDAPTWMADFLPEPFKTNGTVRENRVITEAIFAAWAEGYNDAVTAYAREMHDALQAEGALKDALEDW